MRLDTYTALFQDFAGRHIGIQATAQNGRFLRILISADPVQKQFDLSAFYGAMRDLRVKQGENCFVLENYQAEYGDNEGDYYSRELQGAYLVLQQVDPNNFAARDKAIAACEEIAEDILAAAVEVLRDEHSAHISVKDAWAEHIGPLADGFVGVRMNLRWSEPATLELTYNPAKFL